MFYIYIYNRIVVFNHVHFFPVLSYSYYREHRIDINMFNFKKIYKVFAST